jgi:hypothetical protein
MKAAAPTWRSLCGVAVKICGGQAAFRLEANILKRLVLRYGMYEVETMLLGAQELGWRSLKGLGSRDGLGRRWARNAFWNGQKRGKPLESLGAVLRRAMETP